MRQNTFNRSILLVVALTIISISTFAQKPMRAGTTTANFLEIGFGAAGSAMGDAYVSLANDVSAIYWNPAGLAQMSSSEVMFVTQPWIVGMNTSFGAVGIVVPDFGSIGASIILMDYGEMDVTTMAYQDGTGERFTARDMAISLSYARNLVEGFSFGASGKIITSSIWHETGTALAFDLGVIIKTNFFSPKGDNTHGLSIGMSMSNYGTSLKYDGLDLLIPVDVDPNGAGNYQSAPGRLSTQDWELPMIFRLGVSVTPICTDKNEFILSVDALHPNNNTESVNIGAQYSLAFSTFGKVFLRGGYKALFMEDSQYGESFGVGIQADVMSNRSLKLEYAYRNIGIFGNAQTLGVSLLF
jgi:opacity protein-like surface antigen